VIIYLFFPPAHVLQRSVAVPVALVVNLYIIYTYTCVKSVASDHILEEGRRSKLVYSASKKKCINIHTHIRKDGVLEYKNDIYLEWCTVYGGRKCSRRVKLGNEQKG
jgi:hypothetical protein